MRSTGPSVSSLQGPLQRVAARLAASQLFSLVLAVIVVVAGGLVFIAIHTRVDHRAPMIEAAKLGRLERQDGPWILGAMIVLMAAFAIILAASAYGRRQLISKTWQWAIIAAAALLAMAPGAAYHLLAGGTASYASAQEYGVVSRDGVVHYPWGQAVSAEITCEPQRADQAVIRFNVAFADGQHDHFSFILHRGDFSLHRGDPSDMIDWDLWLAYVIRQAHRDLPDIASDPACDALVRAVAPPAFQVKYQQLFTPAARKSGTGDK
jgi:hypothetical protein